MSEKIILAGGSGFIGGALAESFVSDGNDVVVLTRHHRPDENGVRFAQWDGHSLGVWVRELESAAAVINLTGKTIACRHTPANRREILHSRTDSVHALGDAISQCSLPPRVFLQASGIGFYGDRADQALDETEPSGEGFPAEVCRRWEGAFDELDLPDTRKAILRIGIVLGREGGALKTLENLTRCFLGGAAGDGRQFMSWIHLADLVGMFQRAIDDPQLTGVFNATAPAPVTNAEFMRQLRRALHRPWSPPVPAPLVHLGAWLMRTEGNLALTSLRCLPQRFLDHEFTFRFPTLPAALAALYANKT